MICLAVTHLFIPFSGETPRCNDVNRVSRRKENARRTVPQDNIKLARAIVELGESEPVQNVASQRRRRISNFDV